MKVAYIFASDMAATFKLATMILPQLETGNHGAKVAGMFFLTTIFTPYGRVTRLVSDYQELQ